MLYSLALWCIGEPSSLNLIQNGAKFRQCIQINEQGVIKYEK